MEGKKEILWCDLENEDRRKRKGSNIYLSVVTFVVESMFSQANFAREGNWKGKASSSWMVRTYGGNMTCSWSLTFIINISYYQYGPIYEYLQVGSRMAEKWGGGVKQVPATFPGEGKSGGNILNFHRTLLLPLHAPCKSKGEDRRILCFLCSQVNTEKSTRLFRKVLISGQLPNKEELPSMEQNLLSTPVACHLACQQQQQQQWGVG